MAAVLTVAILAGGRSRRMGRDKALLPVGGAPLLQRVIDAAAPLSCSRLLVSNSPREHAHFGWPITPDIHPNLGPIGGLCAALHRACTPHLLLLACDMPYLSAPLLRFLAAQIGSHQVAVPDSADGLQPLCAVYSRAVLPAVEAAIARSELGMRRLLETLDARVISPAEWEPFDPQGRAFANLNTPDELRRAQ